MIDAYIGLCEESGESARPWAACVRRVFPPRSCEEQSWYGPYAKDWAPHGTYAGLYGRTISFFLHMHELTGEQEYRQFAQLLRDGAQQVVQAVQAKDAELAGNGVSDIGRSCVDCHDSYR